MKQTRSNPVAVLIVALPLFAVLASVGTAIIALSEGDPPLPGQYHWEGDKLDHDFAQSRRAEELHLSAGLALVPDSSGLCYLTLALDRNSAPPAVNLTLIHVSKPALDRDMRFVRSSTQSSSGATSSYSAPCTALPPDRWHLELSDPQRSWSFRSSIAGRLPQVIRLSPSSPADNPAWQ